MANGAPAATSAVVGRRLESGSPGRCGWVGTVFQRITRRSAPSSASTLWTIVPDGSLQRRAAHVGRYGRAPAAEVALRRERDPRPAHALVAARLAQADDVRAGPLRQVGAQVREPDRSAAPGTSSGPASAYWLNVAPMRRRAELGEEVAPSDELDTGGAAVV